MSTAFRILVVDDNPVNRRILVSGLGKAGYEMLEADSGRRALELAKQHGPDAVLLDVSMPDLDGFAVCEILKADTELADVPVIFITAKTEEEDVEHAFAIGGSDYVTKPFRMGEVKARVSVHLQLRRMRDKLEETHAQLLSAQKLESIGQLAAGIAHEINTPTQYVSDNAHFLQRSFVEIAGALERISAITTTVKDGDAEQALMEVVRTIDEADFEYLAEELPKSLSQSIDGLSRIAEIVLAMKEFSHPGLKGLVLTNLHRAIESTITVARNEWKYVAVVETDFDPDLPQVPCSVGDFNQVILNLVVNAAHAVGDRLDPASGAKGRICVTTRTEPGFARISVSDDGAGIPEEIRQRVFDPFFTTKPVGKGSGQGLAIAHSVIVGMHGGTISVDSEVGVGTTFHVRIPLRASEASDVVSAGSPVALHEG